MINTAVNSTAVIRYSHFARNRIINEYGLMLTEYVGLFQFSIIQGKFLIIHNFVVRLLHTRRGGSMPPFLNVYIILVVGGASAILNTAKFHINIQRVKTCMTSDVMQQA